MSCQSSLVDVASGRRCFPLQQKERGVVRPGGETSMRHRGGEGRKKYSQASNVSSWWSRISYSWHAETITQPVYYRNRQEHIPRSSFLFCGQPTQNAGPTYHDAKTHNWDATAITPVMWGAKRTMELGDKLIGTGRQLVVSWQSKPGLRN